MLIGTNQLVFADGARLSRYMTKLSHESMADVVESTSIESRQRTRVALGLRDHMVTLEGYYDDDGGGLASVLTYPHIARLQHALGTEVGSNVITYDDLIADKRSLQHDAEALVREDIHLQATESGISDEWVFGGYYDTLSHPFENTTGSARTVHLAEDLTFRTEFDRSLLGNPTSLEAYFHVYKYSLEGIGSPLASNAVTRFTIATTNTTQWASAGFTNFSYGPVDPPFTGTAFRNSGISTRYFTPAITYPPNSRLDIGLAVFYKVR